MDINQLPDTETGSGARSAHPRLVKTLIYGYGIVIPLAAALLNLAMFVMWAHATYKMTVDMYERRERQLGMLPEKKESLDVA